MTKPPPDLFCARCADYHKLTKDIIVLGKDNKPTWLTDSLLLLAEDLKWSHKDKDLVERVWLYAASTVISGVEQFGQTQVANILEVNQGIISAKYRTAKVLLEIMESVIIKDSK